MGWRVIEHVGYDDLTEAYMKQTKRKIESLLFRTNRLCRKELAPKRTSIQNHEGLEWAGGGGK